MRCPECGAPGAVEYKQNCYICSHCDNRFKVDDPTQITVDVRPSFCTCGNRVEFQCQLCSSPLCHECDLVEWRKDRESRQIGSQQVLAVPSGAFGYRESRVQGSESGAGDPWNEFHDRRKLWSVTDGKIVEGRAYGLYLYPDDILPVISPGPGRLRHVCCACLENGVPLAIEGIASGKLCEHPACGSAATTNCGCCRSAFCARHVSSQSPAPGRNRFGRSTSIAGLEAQDDRPADYSLKALGLCEICADERTQEAREKVAILAEAHPVVRSGIAMGRGVYRADIGILEGVVYEFPLFMWLEDRKRKNILKRFGEAIESMIIEFETQPRACRRAQYQAANRDHAGYYDLADDRGKRSIATGQA